MVHDSLNQLTCGARQVLWWTPPGQWQWESDQQVAGLLPGSFNPLHEGHLGLCETAGRLLAGRVAVELSLTNADKPTLTAAEAERRCRQFTTQSVAVTAASTFVEKSRVFPGVTFVVGADTAGRIVDPRFYQGSPAQLNAALNEIRQQGCSFLVAARYCNRRLLALDQLAIPQSYQGLFREIPPDDFLMDLSSTEIRSAPREDPPAIDATFHL